jgi:hypothetical protein
VYKKNDQKTQAKVSWQQVLIKAQKQAKVFDAHTAKDKRFYTTVTRHTGDLTIVSDKQGRLELRLP